MFACFLGAMGKRSNLAWIHYWEDKSHHSSVKSFEGKKSGTWKSSCLQSKEDEPFNFHNQPLGKIVGSLETLLNREPFDQKNLELLTHYYCTACPIFLLHHSILKAVFESKVSGGLERFFHFSSNTFRGFFAKNYTWGVEICFLLPKYKVG